MLYFFLKADAYSLRYWSSLLIQWATTSNDYLLTNSMVHFSTKLSFDIRFEMKRVRETARIISKVLRASKETIRMRLRKLT